MSERHEVSGYLPPLPDEHLRAKADKLQEMIERSQRNKWIAERTAPPESFGVDTRDEATVDRVTERIMAHTGWSEVSAFSLAKSILAALEGTP